MKTDPSPWSLAAALVLGSTSAGAAALPAGAERPLPAPALQAAAADHAPELALRREHLHKRSSVEMVPLVSSPMLASAREHNHKRVAPTPADRSSPSAQEQQRLVLAARLRLARNA